VQQTLAKTLHEAQKVIEALPKNASAQSVKEALSSALDLARPYWQRLGLRVVRLSSSVIEIHIPKNMATQLNEVIEEGVLCSAAVYAVRTLWEKAAPNTRTVMQIQRIEFERCGDFSSHLRLKAELPALSRELLYADLQNKDQATQDWSLLITNENEALVAKLNLNCTYKNRKAPESLPLPGSESK
jgi:hypothetical protein